MNILDVVKPTRRICPVIFLIDNSAKMAGEPIQIINDTMKQFLLDLKAMETEDIEIKIAILTYGSGVKWQTGASLVPIQTYMWQDIEIGGDATLGYAYYELENALSNGFLLRTSASPVIFLFSDGTSIDDYTNALKRLKQKTWFRVAKKIVIPVNNVFNSFASSRKIFNSMGLQDIFSLQQLVTEFEEMVDACAEQRCIDDELPMEKDLENLASTIDFTGDPNEKW